MKNEIAIFGWRIQSAFNSMKAQVLPAMTASVMSTKPTAMDLETSSSSVPSGGQAVVEFAGLLGLQLALLEEVEQGSHGGEQQGGVAQQDEHDVHGEPGVADDGAATRR